MTLRADIAIVSRGMDRRGPSDEAEAWLRLRRLLVALDEVARRHERAEDDTREVPTR